MKPFRERNPIPIGIAGFGAIAMLVVLAFNAGAVPFVGGGHTYTAQFREAAGLAPSDEVRVAGVRVGEVDSVELDGAQVRVEFRVSDTDVVLGEETGASIRIKTLLGQKYLSLEPAGSGQLEPDTEIPLARTVAPYDVIEAVSDLTSTSERIDTDRLSEALDTLSETFENTPDDVQSSLEGLSRLSQTIASRDEQLQELLERTNKVSAVLSERDEDLVTLVADSRLLLAEIRQRRELIHDLLVTSQELSDQLVGLVEDNREQLGPTLRRLRSVVAMLEENQENLDRSLEMLAPFLRVFANTLGTGPWFDTYIFNLVPLPAVPGGDLGLPEDWERMNGAGGGR